MIRSFAHKGLLKFYETGSTAGIQVKHAQRIANILAVLARAKQVQDIGLPGFGLHPLKGNLRGHWAVKVSGNWRIVFRFENGDAHVVDYMDYH